MAGFCLCSKNKNRVSFLDTLFWSGRQDSNLRPSRPKAGYATGLCHSSNKVIIYQVTLNTSFLDFLFKHHCLTSGGTRYSGYYMPGHTLRCVFTFSCIMLFQPLIYIIRYTRIVSFQRIAE